MTIMSWRLVVSGLLLVLLVTLAILLWADGQLTYLQRPEGDLPSTIERSDKKAQEIYTKTLESAEETYKGDDEAAHRVAFAALKHQYKKEGDRWVWRGPQGGSAIVLDVTNLR